MPQLYEPQICLQIDLHARKVSAVVIYFVYIYKLRVVNINLVNCFVTFIQRAWLYFVKATKEYFLYIQRNKLYNAESSIYFTRGQENDVP